MHRELWEDTAVGALLSRRQAGGARPAAGPEADAVRGALARAPLLRRLALRFVL